MLSNVIHAIQSHLFILSCYHRDSCKARCYTLSLFLWLIRPPSVHNEIKDVSCASLPSFPFPPTPPITHPPPFLSAQCLHVITCISLHVFLDLETIRIPLKETSSTSGDISVTSSINSSSLCFLYVSFCFHWVPPWLKWYQDA